MDTAKPSPPPAAATPSPPSLPSPSPSPSPSPEIVRALTDEHVLRALIRHRRLTRAELAVEIGISKPTAGESVRRLEERGLVADTGERTQGGRGRGRVGSYYSLSPAIGTALAVAIAPEGVVAESVDIYGDTGARTTRPAHPSEVHTALKAAAAEIHDGATQPIRLAVVSAADPVNRATGRLVHLPDSPFLVGELDPVAILAPYADGGDVVVDNDVNWAALAERGGGRDFAYLYLGEGLGCAIVDDGTIRRGNSGLTGEIAHLITTGRQGRAVPLIELFGQLGLRRPGSTAIDVEKLLNSQDHEIIGTGVAGVVAALIALADPQEVVIGGAWGPVLVDQIRAATDRMPRQVPIRAAELTHEPALTGARAEAVTRLRQNAAARVLRS